MAIQQRFDRRDSETAFVRLRSMLGYKRQATPTPALSRREPHVTDVMAQRGRVFHMALEHEYVDTGECHWHPEVPEQWPRLGDVVKYRDNVHATPEEYHGNFDFNRWFPMPLQSLFRRSFS
jgi:hypothetical protein